MKHVFITLGLLAAILATILAVLPLSSFAIFLAVAALIFGFIAFYLSKKTGYVNKIIPFTFILTTLAISISIYNVVFRTDEVGNTETFIQKEEHSKQEAIEELETVDLEP